MLPWIHENLISIVRLLPFAGALMIALLPVKHRSASREMSLVTATLAFAITAVLFTLSINVTEKFPLLVMLLLSASVVTFLAVSWKEKLSRGKCAGILLFESAYLWFFSSQDIVLSYALMELGLFFWGALFARGVKFISFACISSFLFLIVVASLSTGTGSAGIGEIAKTTLTGSSQLMLLGLLFTASMMRMGLFPFHSWVKEALRESGSPFAPLFLFFSFIVSAFFFYSLLPPLAVAMMIMRSALIWIVIGSSLVTAIIAISRKDRTELVAHILLGAVSFIVLGLVSANPAGMSGALFFAVAAILPLLLLGISTAPSGQMKGFSTLALFALVGIPGLSQFPALLMIWTGLFSTNYLQAILSFLVALLLSSAVASFIIKDLFAEEVTGKRFAKRCGVEMSFAFPALLLILAVGIFPDTLMKIVKGSTEVVWAIFSKHI